MTDIKTVSYILLIFGLLDTANAVSKHQINIIVSFDGFQYKFLNKTSTPTLATLKEKGAWAPYMMNVFPTKTFTNHFSIATGRYTEDHGVIGNKLFDAISNKTIRYSEEMFTFNKSIEPIWTLNQKAGGDRHSGVMMWPGGEFAYKEILPTFNELYHSNISLEARVDTVIEWILHPVTPANLIMIYFQDPDQTEHYFGRYSSQVSLALRRADNGIKYLLEQLDKNNIVKYNLIVTSDHGMCNVNYENVVDLNRIIDNNTYHYYDSSPILHIYPNPGQHEEVLNAFKSASVNTNSYFKAFTKEEIPERWRFKNTARAPPILLVADIGYVFNDVYNILRELEHLKHIVYGPGSVFGVHGYDPKEDDMHPVFVAYGTSFKTNYSINVFNTVDLYSLFAKALDLDIPPDSHSGNFTNVQSLFVSNVATSLSKKMKSLISIHSHKNECDVKSYVAKCNIAIKRMLDIYLNPNIFIVMPILFVYFYISS